MNNRAEISIKSDFSTPKETKAEEGCILTNRLVEYLVLAALGFGNSKIAKILCVEISTVKKSFEAIFKKIHAVNRASMIDIGWTHGIINNSVKHQIINKYHINYPIKRHENNPFNS